MKTLQAVRGMHDILPSDAARWQWLEQRLAERLTAYGFGEIRIPVVEKTELFTRAIGQGTDVVEKEMYAFPDRNGESLCLRPEGTAGVVRAVLQHGLLNPPGLKVWYQGPMFRHERPQKGRQRQFHQTGVEIFGMETPETDAELIAMAGRLWRELGVDHLLRLEINSLGDREDRERYRTALVDYLRPRVDRLDADSQRRLETNPLRILDSKNPETRSLLVDAPRLDEHLGDEARRHFERVTALLDALGIAWTHNPGLVRGLDYYCRTVFEWTTDALGAQGTVCAGGRYDDLVEIQGGRATPGIGFALGMERLLALVESTGQQFEHRPHAYLVSSEAGAARLGLAERLRDHWPALRLITDLQGGSFKAQFKRADRSGAAVALVLGEAELAAGEVTIKDLRGDSPQSSVPADRLGAELRRRFATDGPDVAASGEPA
ncbi:histidine--tRNA ligase [Wenzhouxiangella sp. XN79A]|uniref:histidine--tRNA ligase n=1 Tax=Wenzhouxiangella sp. XN79A TaxID=2724193 RepID=UPI00144AE21A|nr:histidine--tRNA ligase [Wenzhouxiangella sp. XN79A]NKI34553.1 histidine--tRNA ligase [Wenzhouxiangella sp. XN79A]